MKTLILCRHAKSEWPQGVPDISRPLKQRGVRDANFLGDLLRSQAFRPDLIVTSPAMRARQTAEIISTCISYPGEMVEEADVYYRGETELLHLIRRLPHHVETAMIFGHNPTMENVAQMLLRMHTPLSMPTCAMVCVESDHEQWRFWNPGEVALRWYLIPRLKRKDADGGA